LAEQDLPPTSQATPWTASAHPPDRPRGGRL